MIEGETFRPITMQDVRLAVGEGKLTPAEVLAGCNAELARRASLAATALSSMKERVEESERKALMKHKLWKKACDRINALEASPPINSTVEKG